MTDVDATPGDSPERPEQAGTAGGAEEAVEVPLVPPMVYVPVGAVPDGEDVEIVFRRTLDGRMALVLYTALDRLVDCCGPHQPWVVMPTEKLGEVKKVQPFDVVYLDLEMPEEERERPPLPDDGADEVDAADGVG